MGFLLAVERNGSAPANVLAAVGNAAPAGIADVVTGHGAFITSDVDDLDDVGIVFIPTQSQLDTFLHDGPLLVDAAPHSGLILNNELGNLGVGVQQAVLKGIAGNLPQYLILQILHLCVEFSVLNGN